MDALRIKNLRCLTDTGRVPIRPITLLVGRNSSGKSTFLRAFPLLRQSVETPRESPILWYHERFVDFGSFAEAVNERAKERSITFEFELPPTRAWFTALPAYTMAVTLVEGDGGAARIRSYQIKDPHQCVNIEIGPDGGVTRLQVDGETREFGGLSLRLSGNAFLMPAVERAGQSRPVAYLKYRRGKESDVPLMLDGLVRAPRTPEVTFLLGLVTQMLAADQLISDFAAHVAYLAPLRATAVRGYRIQDLSVSEIDPRGENLAMFLRSLSAEELHGFADFTRRHLDFDASLRVLGLHADILVREARDGRAKNLVDVGSGYAQVLPLAAILWSTCVRKPRRDSGHPSLLAIEQPELHLHPAHQARLTRMFAGAMLESRAAGRPVKLLIETHSEALVNGLGDLVHEKLLSPEDVQIAIFDQDDTTHDTTVHLSEYDEDGALRNWPYGFFNPIDDHREAAE